MIVLVRVSRLFVVQFFFCLCVCICLILLGFYGELHFLQPSNPPNLQLQRPNPSLFRIVTRSTQIWPSNLSVTNSIRCIYSNQHPCCYRCRLTLAHQPLNPLPLVDSIIALPLSLLVSPSLSHLVLVLLLSSLPSHLY